MSTLKLFIQIIFLGTLCTLFTMSTSFAAPTSTTGMIIPAYFDPITYPMDWTAINTIA